ncbi:helix-turn-helix domain-containing protein [Nocardia vaccinii]|uniref:helix-turn-helix domain-containing protein n=1 Tax=Nocardia vaccinii TaxID=1822 RepID=UPI001471903F|nr:helix-turn-helix transcriptional regulator [Nocardia vaccinii]
MNSVLERRELGRRLRSLRTNAKFSRSAAAQAIEVSPQTIWRVENGEETRISTLHVAELCTVYKADDQERAVVLELAQDLRTARRNAGNHRRGEVTAAMAGFVERVELEQAAIGVTIFASTLLPGLLRTTDYHRGVRARLHPQDSTTDVETWEKMADFRRIRLHDKEFHVQAYLLQSALRQIVDGPELMAQQLAYLGQLDQLPNVSIRIIPWEAGVHVGLHLCGFTLLEFGAVAGGGQVYGPAVYTKSSTEGPCITDEGDIDRYRTALVELDRAALSPDGSRMQMGKIEQKHWARTKFVHSQRS